MPLEMVSKVEGFDNSSLLKNRSPFLHDPEIRKVFPFIPTRFNWKKSLWNVLL